MTWEVFESRQSMTYYTIRVCGKINLYDLDLIINCAFTPDLTQTIRDVRELRRMGYVKKVNYQFIAL